MRNPYIPYISIGIAVGYPKSVFMSNQTKRVQIQTRISRKHWQTLCQFFKVDPNKKYDSLRLILEYLIVNCQIAKLPSPRDLREKLREDLNPFDRIPNCPYCTPLEDHPESIHCANPSRTAKQWLPRNRIINLNICLKCFERRKFIKTKEQESKSTRTHFLEIKQGFKFCHKTGYPRQIPFQEICIGCAEFSKCYPKASKT